MTEQHDILQRCEKLERDVLVTIRKPSRWYWLGLMVTVSLMGMMFALWFYMIMKGMGVTHLDNPIGWAVLITNFVFWVGIAHSGTLISAILFLFRARFRNRFNRTAEAMTIFAVMVAGMFPLMHLGRVWYAFYLFPYPNQRTIWPNFKSPLVWDVFAVSTYFTVSCMFFYLGMIPDLAIAKRYCTGVRQWFYRVFSLGWTGSGNQWRHYLKAYGLLAAFATPLVISVHSVVSWDFAMSILPGWHTTLFAPYFVAGAIFSGCAMVITLVIPMRKIMGLEEIITVKHFESLAQMLLLTSLIVTYSYIVEFALAFYSGNPLERYHFMFRALGNYHWLYFLMMFCNVIFPLSLFIKKCRTSIPFLFVLSLFVNVGMWLERFIIIVTALFRDYDPYSWNVYTYKPSYVEVLITVGSFGMFLTLFLLFVKTIPVLAITEIKEEIK